MNWIGFNGLNVTMTAAVNESEVFYNVTTLSSDMSISISISSSYERFITVLETSIIAVVSSGIILSNIVNLIVLLSASGAMPWATRLFLVNLSVSDILVGFIACAPAVLPAATNRWTYAQHSCSLPDHATSLTGGHTVMPGVRYLESLTAFQLLSPSGVSQ